MYEILIRDIARPVVDRIASNVGAFFAGLGVAATDVDNIEKVAVIVIGVGIDLVVRKIGKKA